jgi:hypothetical protein
MSFATALTEDLNTFLNVEEFGTTVAYAGTDIAAIVDYGSAGRIEEYSRDYKAEKATLFIKKSDVAAPGYRDVVVIDSVTWYVMREIKGDDEVWEIGIERGERVELL